MEITMKTVRGDEFKVTVQADWTVRQCSCSAAALIALLLAFLTRAPCVRLRRTRFPARVQVLQVKEELVKLKSYALGGIKLICAGKVLKDAQTLSAIGVVEGSFMVVMVSKVRGVACETARQCSVPPRQSAARLRSRARARLRTRLTRHSICSSHYRC